MSSTMTTENSSPETRSDWSPPYTSFTTLMNTVDRMSTEGGVPARVDRSYLSNMPGGVRPTFVAGIRAIDLIDAESKPTQTFIDLVKADEAGRKEIVADILRRYYDEPLKLGAMATQSQLEEKFRAYGISGSTMRKAVGFFLAATKYADIKVSPHFKLPKREPGTTVRRKSTQAQTPDPTPEVPQTPTRDKKLHALIEGLIAELPASGEPFPQEKQDTWLELARMTFRLIYSTGDTASPATARTGFPPSSGGGGSD